MSGTLVAPWMVHTSPLVTDDLRVAHLVDSIWRERFPDVPRVNQMVAGYDYPWKWRLGRIRMSVDTAVSEIALNGLLDSPTVPEAIRIAIIAHEIVHYAQGFGSPLPRAQRHAHAHGAVSHELARRGLALHERMLDDWSYDVWPQFRDSQLLQRARRARATAWSPCATVAKVVY